MTFESEGLLIVAIYIWLPPASYVVFSDNSGSKSHISYRIQHIYKQTVIYTICIIQCKRVKCQVERRTQDLSEHSRVCETRTSTRHRSPPQHTFFFQIHHYFTSIHTTIKDERLLYAVYKYLPRLFCLYSVTVLI